MPPNGTGICFLGAKDFCPDSKPTNRESTRLSSTLFRHSFSDFTSDCLMKRRLQIVLTHVAITNQTGETNEQVFHQTVQLVQSDKLPRMISSSFCFQRNNRSRFVETVSPITMILQTRKVHVEPI